MADATVGSMGDRILNVSGPQSSVDAPSQSTESSASHPGGFRGVIRDLMVLTKFRINLVGVFTGYAAIAVWQWMHPAQAAELSAGHIWLCLLALLLIGGSANTCNQIIEKNRDGKMARTRDRRPLPSGRMSIPTAITIAVVQAVAGVALFELVFQSHLASILGLFTIAYYALFYTWYLKPRHYLNIVIGGVPGAMGPLLAWAAIDGGMAWEPMVLFGIIFLWTPPHFLGLGHQAQR